MFIYIKFTGKKFGYVRGSSNEQNYKYQIEKLKKQGINEVLIFADKESGKNFERKDYIRLKEILDEGDELYITALDRFGRNLGEMEIKQGDETMFKRMYEMMFKFMSYMDEMERKKIKKNQSQGIDSMPVDEVTGKRISTKAGRAMGRLARQFSEGWECACNN